MSDQAMSNKAMSNERPNTLGALKQSGYQSTGIREEIKRNLMVKLRNGETLFPGIVGYETSVLPQLENALLAGQDIILLGERGQAKTRIIRSLTSLLDEWVPILADCAFPEDPCKPVSFQAKQLVDEQGDDCKIVWLHRDKRFAEKLATPDITIADLIGEVDPIKVAEGRYLSDAMTLHYGMIPMANRGIFAINELPDLSERIQVGLLNVMEEKDVQIRGHNIRLDLDIIIVATANPEDYTNRGRIITPLKDRYGAQIRTHYPMTIAEEIEIMRTEAQTIGVEGFDITVPDYMEEIIAEISHGARVSRDLNQRSGISVRASIANFETLIANATRRAIRLDSNQVVPRISDLPFIISSLQGKLEFEVIDEEQEGLVVEQLIEDAVYKVFSQRFLLEELQTVAKSFRENTSADTGEALHPAFYQQLISEIEGLSVAVKSVCNDDTPEQRAAAAEFILEGLHLAEKLNKKPMGGKMIYPDSNMDNFA